MNRALDILADADPAEGRSIPWWHGWAPLVVLPVAVVVLIDESRPRWAMMWLLAIAIFAGCKWLTWRRTPPRGSDPVPWHRHAGYLLAWPGLDAHAFLEPRPPHVQPPTRAEWLDGALRGTAGLAMFFILAPLAGERSPLLAGWVAMVALVLALHFGLFTLLSCAWRAAGVDAAPLMHRPSRATTLFDFWSRRWNTAFRDLTHRFLFQPLSSRLGPGGGLWAGFIFSGLVHDLVISYPAGGGYGGPTLYFALQAAGISLQRSGRARRMGLGRGWRGWAFTFLFLLAPLPLLLHAPFVLEVIVPFMRDTAALLGA